MYRCAPSGTQGTCVLAAGNAQSCGQGTLTKYYSCYQYNAGDSVGLQVDESYCGQTQCGNTQQSCTVTCNTQTSQSVQLPVRCDSKPETVPL